MLSGSWLLFLDYVVPISISLSETAVPSCIRVEVHVSQGLFSDVRGKESRSRAPEVVQDLTRTPLGCLPGELLYVQPGEALVASTDPQM